MGPLGSREWAPLLVPNPTQLLGWRDEGWAGGVLNGLTCPSGELHALAFMILWERTYNWFLIKEKFLKKNILNWDIAKTKVGRVLGSINNFGTFIILDWSK